MALAAAYSNGFSPKNLMIPRLHAIKIMDIYECSAVGYTLTELKLSVHVHSVSKPVCGIMLAPVKKDKQSDRSHRVLASILFFCSNTTYIFVGSEVHITSIM